MNCLLCGHDSYLMAYFIRQYRLSCCRQCGHAVTDPMPSREELATMYNESYFSGRAVV